MGKSINIWTSQIKTKYFQMYSDHQVIEEKKKRTYIYIYIYIYIYSILRLKTPVNLLQRKSCLW